MKGQNDIKKSGRGGRREGAGHPKLPEAERKKSIGIRLPVDLYDFVKMQKNKSTFIEEVLRFYIENKGITL